MIAFINAVIAILIMSLIKTYSKKMGKRGV